MNRIERDAINEITNILQYHDDVFILPRRNFDLLHLEVLRIDDQETSVVVTLKLPKVRRL